VERLIKIGATRYRWRYRPGDDFILLADPDDNLFCVVQLNDSLECFNGHLRYERMGEEVLQNQAFHIAQPTVASILASRAKTHFPFCFVRMDSVWPARVID
jgi:hypothetical protein